MNRLFSILIISILSSVSLYSQKIGTWNAYMAYGDITAIETADDFVFVLSSNGLYAYNINDQSIQTYDKVSHLNDCNIQHIAYCKQAKRLIVVYSNQNIDLLELDGKVISMSEYHNKALTVNKNINHIDIYGNDAYLSTGFGIIKINVKDALFTDSYMLGFNVDYCYIEKDKIHAASSSSGIYSAPLSGINLLDKSNWKLTDGYKELDENKKLVRDEQNNCYWTTEDNVNLMAYREIDGEKTVFLSNIRPEGPKYNYFGFLRFIKNKLYCTNGIVNSVYDSQQPASIQVLDNKDWTIYPDNLNEITGHLFKDIVCIDVDPTDESHVFVAGRCGLYEFKDYNFIQEYNVDNSPLKSAATIPTPNKDYLIVNGIKFDQNGNLWVMNSLSAGTSLFLLTKNGEWISYHNQALMYDESKSLENMKSPIIDSRGMIWFVNDHWRTPALICFDTKNNKVYNFKTFVNQDGTTINITFGRCVAEDKEGNIWFGTNVGPLMLRNDDILKIVNSGINENTEFVQVKVPRNDGTNFADYLLSGLDIMSICIDDANRKWFGTSGNGVYLMSSDNIEQLYHFTETNSNLLSNNLMDIAINHKNGEVFFGTDKGLCSYMSDANTTYEEMTKENVYAYPNPVRPDYKGLITITGLSLNADIKIVTTNGVLVAQGRSNGGMFTWDGNDLNGKRVASGIYMVQTATAEGNKGTVCKIAIIN